MGKTSPMQRTADGNLFIQEICKKALALKGRKRRSTGTMEK